MKNAARGVFLERGGCRGLGVFGGFSFFMDWFVNQYIPWNGVYLHVLLGQIKQKKMKTCLERGPKLAISKVLYESTSLEALAFGIVTSLYKKNGEEKTLC